MKRIPYFLLILLTFCAGFWVDDVKLTGPNLVTISQAEAGPPRRVARRTARRTSYRHNAYYHSRPYYGAGAAAVTAVAVGTVVATLPTGCSQIVVHGRPYYNCTGTYYQPQYSGSEIIYVVVDSP